VTLLRARHDLPLEAGRQFAAGWPAAQFVNQGAIPALAKAEQHPPHHVVNLERDPHDSGLHELNVEADGDFIADKNAAGLQRSIPSQAEVLTVELGGRRRSQARAAPRILGGRGSSLYGENHRARHVANGQVASDHQFSRFVARDARGL